MNPVPNEEAAQRKKEARLKALETTKVAPIEFKFLTIEDIKEEDMLVTEQIRNTPSRDLFTFERIEKVMRPGQLSKEGFLNATEKLYDIYEKDDETLKRLGITYNQIADKLDDIIQAYKEIEEYSERYIQEPFKHNNLFVTCDCYFGYQECPFGCAQELRELHKEYKIAQASLDFKVTNEITKESIFFSELHRHLIRDHHFFEGHTKYRLDPEQCIKVLEL
jgi:hypothetical protein